MQGYLTMALEAVEQLNGIVPTHVFLGWCTGCFLR